ncbi:MAG: hypothetical protein NC182_00535 [Prevotella sp.]|nr:hypothetical protein [Staphylococcus sp.]MCM1349671.1 hypothetical protein [Prevotella sp.]
MPILIIFITLCIIAGFIWSSFLPKIKRKKAIEAFTTYLNKSNMTYSLQEGNQQFYDLYLELQGSVYYIKFLLLPSYSEVQINNRTTWEVKYGAGKTPGKVQPKKRYLTEIVDFMKADIESTAQKIVILSPKPKKIVKYINESEIVFVKSTTDVYGAHLIDEGQFRLFKNKSK